MGGCWQAVVVRACFFPGSVPWVAVGGIRQVAMRALRPYIPFLARVFAPKALGTGPSSAGEGTGHRSAVCPPPLTLVASLSPESALQTLAIALSVSG